MTNKNYKLKTFLFAFIMLIAGHAVNAATFTVTNTSDAGAGSLRQAILSANGAGGAPHIINVSVSGTITVVTELPAPTQATTFNGNGITISGGNIVRIMAQMQSNGADIAVVFNQVIFTLSFMNGDNGGALCVRQGYRVTINDCQFINNKATGFGGAIAYNISGSQIASMRPLICNRCSFTGNQSTTSHSGAVDNRNGNATFTNCSFIGNSTLAAGTAGGAYSSTFNTETSNFINCTVVGNSCITANSGGGMQLVGVKNLLNNIIYSNTANSVANDVNNGSGAMNQVTNLVGTTTGTGVSWAFTSNPSMGASTSCSNGLAYQVPGSIASNAGSASGASQTAPSIDICGTSRTGLPDLGAKEIPCTNPTVPTLSASSTTNCGAQSTTLSIATGTLNSATNWQWYTGSCGGTSAGSGTSIIVSPSATETYYARGEGGCVIPGSCGDITITVTPPPVCQNGGTVNTPTCSCNCLTGFSGTLCEINNNPPTFGTYSPATVIAGGTVLVTPSSAPVNAASIQAYSTNSNYNAATSANPATGVVRIVAPTKPGIYIITLKAYNSIALSTTTTFTLTVTNPNCSGGTFSSTEGNFHPGEWGGAQEIGDFNNDGIQDIIISRNVNSDMKVFAGNGSGGFTLLSTTAINLYGSDLKLADFNGDGNLDVAMPTASDSKITIFLGNGAGGFTGLAPMIFSGMGELTVADLNNDGIQDIAVAVNNFVNIRLGDGSGNFTTAPDISTTDASLTVIAGDFNNDGNKDLIVSKYPSLDILFFPGNGTGSFGAGTTIHTAGIYTYAMNVGDFDEDGDLDFVAAFNDSPDMNAKIFIGNGNGTFAAPVSYAIGQYPPSVSVGDFNGDGHQDFATNGPAGTIRIYVGSGTGTFTLNVDVPSTFAANFPIIGDFNSDGIQDLAYTRASNGFGVRLGISNEINIQGNSINIADGSSIPSLSDHTDFGNVNLSSSFQRVFTIQNTNEATLNISSITVTGPNNTEFVVLGVPPTSVAGNSSASFTVEFTPTSTGLRTATIHVNNNDCDEADYDFAVQGTGACNAPAFTTCPSAQTANTATGTCATNVSYATATSGTAPVTETYTFTGATITSGSGNGSGSSFNKGVTNVTVTATNTCGTAACSFTVTITDNEAPTITCASGVTINTTTGLCTGTTVLAAPTVSDNCPLILGNGLNFDGVDDKVEIPHDASQNSLTLTLECWIKTTDVNGGTLINKYLNASGNGWAMDFGTQLRGYYYSASANVLVTGTATINNGAWHHVATVFDASGAKLYVDGVLDASLAWTGTPIASTTTQPIHLGITQINVSTTFYEFNGTMDEARIWNVARSQAQIQASMNSQLSGGESNLVSYYNFNQGTPGGTNTGIITLPDLATTIGGANDGTLTNFALTGATSNWVDGVTIGAATNNAPSTYPLGNTTVTWTATDASGNTATCNQLVTVVDNQAPVLSCPSNVSINVIANTCAANYIIADPVSDNCTGATWGYTLTGATTSSASAIADGTGSGSLSFNKGTTTVTLNGTDGTNSATTCSFTVTVNDNEAPVITCASGVTINTTTGLCTGTTTLTNPVISDNCVSTALGNALNFAVNTNKVTIANNPVFNFGTGDFTIEMWVKYTTNTFQILADKRVGAAWWRVAINSGPIYFETSATQGAMTVTTSYNDGNWHHIACVRSGITPIIYVDGVAQATNLFGTFNTNISNTNPVTLGGFAGSNCCRFNGSMDEVRIWNVARTQAQISANMYSELSSQANLLAMYHLNEGTANGTNTGITTAADASGNGYNGTLTGFALSGITSNWVTGNIITTSPITPSNNAPSTYPLGNTTVIWTATDVSGNTATCNQLVTVVDNQAPVLSCPSNVSMNVVANTCANSYTIADPISDNCTGATWGYTLTGATTGSASAIADGTGSGSLSFNKGTTTVTLNGTDGANGATGCSFTVTVNDNENPTISCPADVVSCSTTPSLGSPTIGDNCPGVTASNNAPATFPTGTTVVTWTATDASGNIAICTQNVTVNTPSVAATSATSDAPLNEICNGSSTNLTVNGGSLGTGAVWNWYSGSCTGTLAGTGTSISVSPTANTTYFVKAEGACNITTCMQVSIVVKTAPPSANIVVPPINNLPAYACNGTFVANINVPSVTGATQYIWDGPTGTTFNGSGNPYTSPTPTANITFGNPNGSGYYIGIQAANSCGASLRKVQWVRGIISVPAGVVPAVAGLTAYCPNTTATFSCPAVTAATGYLWTITGDATLVPSGNSVTVNFGPSWTGGTLCVSGQTPCYTTVAKCLSLSTSAGTAYSPTGLVTVCPLSSQTYSVPAQVNISSYSWTLPANTSGSSTSNSINANFLSGFSSGNVCVTATTVCGVALAQKCKSIASGVPAKPASITGATNGICGLTTTYTCPSQAGVNFNWTYPSGGSGSSITNAIGITFPGSGFTTGSVCVNAQNACGTSAGRCITVKGAPNTPGVIIPDPSAWCAPSSGIEFLSDVSTLGGSYSLIWSWIPASAANYVIGQGTNDLIVDWISAGATAVLLKAQNACGNATRSLAVNPVACRMAGSQSGQSSDFSDGAQFSAYPNPALDMININFTSNNEQKVTVRLNDLTGKVILEKAIEAVAGYNYHSLDVSHLAKGIYLLNLSNDGTGKIKIAIN